MHYYSFHVSDYIHDTSHLSPMEDLAFRRLLDLYYTSEKPIPNQTHTVARRIRLPKNEHDVSTVLEEFFQFDFATDSWTHKRCDETIAAYQAKAQRNREVGKLGGRPKANLDGNHEQTQTVSKHNPNQEPLTINQEPKKRATVVAIPDGVGEQVWQDWLQLRKAKKAPVTQTVLNSATREAEKAGISLNAFLTIWCARGSQGLEADWLKSNERQPFVNKYDVAHVTTPPPPNQDAALRKIEEDRKNAAPPSLEVLARMAALRQEIKNG
jgi:uncharacterized protein YdaU (DUF1376 family)